MVRSARADTALPRRRTGAARPCRQARAPLPCRVCSDRSNDGQARSDRMDGPRAAGRLRRWRRRRRWGAGRLVLDTDHAGAGPGARPQLRRAGERRPDLAQHRRVGRLADLGLLVPAGADRGRSFGVQGWRDRRHLDPGRQPAGRRHRAPGLGQRVLVRPQQPARSGDHQGRPRAIDRHPRTGQHALPGAGRGEPGRCRGVARHPGLQRHRAAERRAGGAVPAELLRHARLHGRAATTRASRRT